MSFLPPAICPPVIFPFKTTTIIQGHLESCKGLEVKEINGCFLQTLNICYTSANERDNRLVIMAGQ